jgi:hypothetical protein
VSKASLDYTMRHYLKQIKKKRKEKERRKKMKEAKRMEEALIIITEVNFGKIKSKY